jgi:hypothetical protein
MKLLSIALLISLLSARNSFAQEDEGPQYVTKQLPPATVFHGSRNIGNGSPGRTPATRVFTDAAGRRLVAPGLVAPGLQPGQNPASANNTGRPQQQQTTTRLVFDQYGRPIVLQLDPKLDPFRRPNDDTEQQKPKTPQELAQERAALQSQRFFREIYSYRRSTHNQSQYNYSTHNITRSNQTRPSFQASQFSRHNQQFRPSFHNQSNFNQSRRGYSFHLQRSSQAASHLWR